ncbi:MAG: replication-associated recombination protein A [Patescibacteria group bacterium]
MSITPIAHLLRPKTFSDFVGQSHLVGEGKPITEMVKRGTIPSLIFWGPPGCGKTTLAYLIARNVEAELVAISAVDSGKEDVKKAIAKGFENQALFGKNQTILFVDEIHRFNKAQQDALLKAVEEGTVTLIATTTENPGFSVIPALVSRSHVFMLHALTDVEMKVVIKKALSSYNDVKIEKKAEEFLLSYSSGDARKLLNALDLAATSYKNITVQNLESILQKKTIRYDKTGEDHYNTISAFIKSMRGGQPDAALHYLARMIEGGEDPMFIARRMVIFASEDVGNATPTALVVANATMQAISQIGMPEGRIILAQCATYLATAKKSTASYDGIEIALSDVHEKILDPIPLHLRNAVNKVVKGEGYGEGHIRYPWKEEKEGREVTQEYMPENLKGKKYYNL